MTSESGEILSGRDDAGAFGKNDAGAGQTLTGQQKRY